MITALVQLVRPAANALRQEGPAAMRQSASIATSSVFRREVTLEQAREDLTALWKNNVHLYWIVVARVNDFNDRSFSCPEGTEKENTKRLLDLGIIDESDTPLQCYADVIKASVFPKKPQSLTISECWNKIPEGKLPC